MRRPETCQPCFSQPRSGAPSTAFQFPTHKSWSQEQWLKCWLLHSWRSAGTFRIQVRSFFLLFSSPINPEIWIPLGRRRGWAGFPFPERMCQPLGQCTQKFPIAIADIKESLEHLFILWNVILSVCVRHGLRISTKSCLWGTGQWDTWLICQLVSPVKKEEAEH